MINSYSLTSATLSEENATPEEDVFIFPLSFSQQRLWFLDQLEPGSAHYNIPLAMRLTGALDVQALEQTLSEIIRRHEALRTTFNIVDGDAVQMIGPAFKLKPTAHDLSELPTAERESEALRLAAQEAQRPFDLSAGPLLRASLLRLAADEHIALLTMHHIISDGWSTGVLIREVAALYEAYSQGRNPTLAELPIQYADYAVWQREWLKGEVLERQLDYWKQQLSGAATLELPTDRPRPVIQSTRGAHEDFALNSHVTEGLKRLSQQHGATLFMTLLAAWQTLLSRYSGQDDISVGTPIAGRNRRETEELIGFFVNTLVLRTDLAGDPSFTELLKRVREVALGAYAHQDVPFEKLVEELQPERDLSRSPLFQVMFALQNTPQKELKLPGLRLSFVDPEQETAKFDLMLMLSESATGMTGSLVYNTDLYNRETIRRLSAHLSTLLSAIVSDPNQRLSSLPLLSAAEQQQLLSEFNPAPSTY
ncbi:MAG TPA: condensation domain-containing protein, partial [Pyrinomonadaceae bacterium]